MRLVPGMKKALLIWLLLQLTVSASASGRVTVEQLSRVVVSSHEKPDSKIADRLFGLELTERLNDAKLAEFLTALPGPKSRRALVALADQATFLDPPPAEIPTQPAPTLEQQRAITAKAVDYIKSTLSLLPNLFASRDTISFQDTPAVLKGGGLSAPSGTFVPAQPLHPVSRSTRTVTYRDGQEIAEAPADKQGASASRITGLTTSGEFGPILIAVFSDLPQGHLAWSHWEQGAANPVAVFRFRVPVGASHYQVKFCCVDGRVFEHSTAYHGEVIVDPADGTILRLTLISDLSKSDPIAKAELMVEYGPVELGKQKYFCPIKSVSLSVASMQIAPQKPFSGGVLPSTRGAVQIEVQDNSSADELPQTLLNEVIFNQYHLFHSESRILTADNSESGSAPGAAVNAASTQSLSSVANPNQQPSLTNENPEPAASATAAVAKADDAAPVVLSSTAPAPAPEPPAPPPTPEISVAAPADLPKTPAAPAPASTEAKFSLRVSTRLVDVSITAYDRKGKPVTDLTRDDFVISDNGKKQNPRSFSHATTVSAGPEIPAISDKPVLYSNRLDATSLAQPAGVPAPENSTLILLDATSLGISDLAAARERILGFLDKLPASEPVGLYIRAGYGFRVLAEGTTDHAALISALKGWTPTAQDLALAREDEVRNRQQFDTVQSSSDLQFVGGNIAGTTSASSELAIPGGTTSNADPKLSKEGTNSARQALTVVVAVAAHMGSIPGHKNLVWIASDSVLANWTDQGSGKSKGNNSVAGLAIRTQEALNDAHVSLYPVDASQLETSSTDASLQNAGVELDPSAKDNMPVAAQGEVTPGPGARASAEMQQNIRPVEAAVQQMAQATGGRSFTRSGNLAAVLTSVIEDGQATYLLSFAPDTQPDDQYHLLTVAVPTRRGITLRYRNGYLYSKEPSVLKDRFKQAIWQPLDSTEIAISAHRASASAGAAVTLAIAANDVTMAQQGDRWTGRLNIFLVQRDETGMRAELKEQTLALSLKDATYQKVQRDGIPFDEYVDNNQDSGTIRIIVVDESSGRIGSITLPAAVEHANP
jgi:VWFA-related protein